MATKDFKNSQTRKRLDGSNAVGPYIDGFTAELQQAGYRDSTICECLCAATHLGCWLEAEGGAVQDLSEDALEAFAQHFPCDCFARKRVGYASVIGKARHFLGYLRRLGVVASGEDRQPLPGLPVVEGFVHWMRMHRGLQDSTLRGYRHVVIDLLQTIGGDPGQFHVRDLRAFVLGRAKRQTSTPKSLISAVRMFLRYLIAEGRCASGLDDGIPSIAQWRLSALPRYLPASDVERVVEACDPATPVGCRDRAVVLLLARLALRASDVVQLRLGDIDWERGTLLASGKGRRAVCLPLLQDVGDALLQYIECVRPPVKVDQVFVRSRAPLRPLSGADAVCAIVAAAIRRAGVKAPSRGAHVLRHSLATEMLRQGASLQEIGSLLRHRSIETTTLYAKVDIHALQAIAQPWPEALPC